MPHYAFRITRADWENKKQNAAMWQDKRPEVFSSNPTFLKTAFLVMNYKGYAGEPIIRWEKEIAPDWWFTNNSGGIA